MSREIFRHAAREAGSDILWYYWNRFFEELANSLKRTIDREFELVGPLINNKHQVGICVVYRDHPNTAVFEFHATLTNKHVKLYCSNAEDSVHGGNFTIGDAFTKEKQNNAIGFFDLKRPILNITEADELERRVKNKLQPYLIPQFMQRNERRNDKDGANIRFRFE